MLTVDIEHIKSLDKNEDGTYKLTQTVRYKENENTYVDFVFPRIQINKDIINGGIDFVVLLDDSNKYGFYEIYETSNKIEFLTEEDIISIIKYEIMEYKENR